MIEAMARALPCIGSTVGGIPELLPREDMVDPNDARSLADMIREVLTHPARMEAMSSLNLRRAGDYREEALAGRRRAFYREIRDLTRTAAGQARKQPAPPRVVGSGTSS
jgi:glycosyltransferase involved in cell wall biosynthesis